MKTTFFPWTSACLSAVLFASGCATSRHSVTQTYRPSMDSEAIARRELKATPRTDNDSTSKDNVVESPKTVSNPDRLNDPESNEIMPVGFEVLNLWPS
jgi:hypothetical protein